jgi:hypothetical protein
MNIPYPETEAGSMCGLQTGPGALAVKGVVGALVVKGVGAATPRARASTQPDSGSG